MSSLATWATLALTAAIFPACAKSIIGESGGEDAGGVSVGNDASTIASGDDSGTGDPSQGGGSSPSDDAGTGNPSSGSDSGSSSGNEDSGSTSPPASDDSGTSPPVADSAPPPSAATCPDTSTYQEEYEILASFGLGTSCTTDSDCGSSDCCYDGTLAQGTGGLCVTQ